MSRGQGRVASSVAVRRGGSVRARAKRALWARPEHARYPLDEMQGGLEREGGAGS